MLFRFSGIGVVPTPVLGYLFIFVVVAALLSVSVLEHVLFIKRLRRSLFRLMVLFVCLFFIKPTDRCGANCVFLFSSRGPSVTFPLSLP